MLHSKNLVSAVAALLIAGAACSQGGGDRGDRDTAAPGAVSDANGPADVTITATEFAFAPDPVNAPAGTVTVALVNEGAIPHTLLVEGLSGPKLAVAARGERDTGAFELAPGTYTMYCDIAGHRAAGMEATLNVE